MKIQENVVLAPYTTLGVGGPARWFVETGSDEEMLKALRFAREQKVPLFVLGGGSNLLVSDEGFGGVVLHIVAAGAAQVRRRDGLVLLQASAGVDWDAVVRLAVAENAAGIECLAGIPGSVGGTPVQNVGAYGQEVSQTICRVDAIDVATNIVARLTPRDCGFAYRRSMFNTSQKGRYIILRVEYALGDGGPPSLTYRDVKNWFAERGTTAPTLGETADAVRAIRARKGMVLAAHDPDSRSAGSFFKNPVVPANLVPKLAQIAGRSVAEVPQFAAGAEHSAGMVKVSAAWLIELAGFRKGFAMGRAGLSSKHVLALVNRGGATAAEICALRDAVVAEVEARTGIRLEQEPVTLGF